MAKYKEKNLLNVFNIGESPWEYMYYIFTIVSLTQTNHLDLKIIYT